MDFQDTASLTGSVYPSLDSNKYDEFFGGLSGKAAVVYGELERRLTGGVYKLGDTIPTADIIREFKISRAPLTAALNQLRSAGYIEIIPQVGSKVIEPTDSQVHDFYLMFNKVEQGMARLAAERRSVSEAAFISDVCQRLGVLSSKLSNYTDEYIRLLELYHSSIHQAAHSPFELLRIRSYMRISAFLLRNGKPVQVFSDMVKVSNKYRPLVTAAIVAGNVAEAEAAMAIYMSSSLEA